MVFAKHMMKVVCWVWGMGRTKSVNLKSIFSKTSFEKKSREQAIALSDFEFRGLFSPICCLQKLYNDIVHTLNE